MKHISGTHWQVESDSGPKIYDVMLHVPHCTCQGWARNMNTQRKRARERGEDENLVTFECKHIRQAREQARRSNLPDGTAEHAERLEELKREETEREAMTILEQFKVKPDEPPETELSEDERNAQALLAEFRKKA